VINPVLDQGVIYVGFNDLQVPPGPFLSGRIFGGVSAVDASSGRILWTTLIPHPDSTVPSTTLGVLVSSGRVIAGSADGSLFALDATTGAIVQSIPRAQFITATPASNADQKVFAASGTTLLVGSLFGTISAWSITDLRRLWIVNIQVHGSVIDLTADQDFVYASYVGGQFSVSNVTDGKFAWLIDAAALRNGFGPIAAAPAIDGDRIYLGGFQASYAMKRD
jgi:outer membrane protein assembly factor BamB